MDERLRDLRRRAVAGDADATKELADELASLGPVHAFDYATTTVRPGIRTLCDIGVEEAISLSYGITEGPGLASWACAAAVVKPDCASCVEELRRRTAGLSSRAHRHRRRTVRSGNGPSSGDGGTVTITAGSAMTGNGGSITLQAGVGGAGARSSPPHWRRR